MNSIALNIASRGAFEPVERETADAVHACAAIEPQQASGALTLKLIETRDAFDALEADWNSLFLRAGGGTHVFQTFNFCWHWSRHYLDETARSTKLAIVAAYSADRLVLVLPLVTERTGGLTQIGWMGDPAAQYGDVLLDPDIDAASSLDLAWQHLRAHVKADVVRLRRVRADAVVAPFLATLEVEITARYEAPFLDLASAKSFAAYETRYPAKARKNRRRLLRRLDERANVAFIDHKPGPAAGIAAASAVLLKRDWLASRNQVSKALLDDRMVAFMRDVAVSASHPVDCEVGELKSGTDTASLQIGFRCRDRLALHIIVFHLNFEKAGAGVLHLEQRIKTACEAGVGVLDLLAPKSDYKMDWADGTIDVTDYAIPLSTKGRAFVGLYLMRLRPQLKRFAPYMPRSLRRVVSNSAILLALGV